MKNVYTALALLIGTTAFGQIEQHINKANDTVSHPIMEIDSIRFNADQTEMEIIFNTGSPESHTISDIEDVMFSGEFVGIIDSLDCTGATVNATLIEGQTLTGVIAEINYTGGNGGPYAGDTVSSTGVTGLTAIIDTGNFSNSAGTLSYTIQGEPDTSGTASFPIQVGSQMCALEIVVDTAGPYPRGTVHCTSVPTTIVDVTNPTTGKTWMDRNLGASRQAQSSTDSLSYGDLYQWGRGADGHQCRDSDTTGVLSSTAQPGHGAFITTATSPFDWRSPQNTNLWQGVNGINNPCPSGYRLPTETELNAERATWISNDTAGAFASTLKLPVAGGRSLSDGSLLNVDTGGRYWSSTVSGSLSRSSGFNSMSSDGRARGRSVRCIKD